ncbi:MAG: hypothetical protein EPO40_18710 [Myxococcaceae bacterium]|nr:MAG: hypothetical protein EPO40_18710 [Myxococcaceae bacterium]
MTTGAHRVEVAAMGTLDLAAPALSEDAFDLLPGSDPSRFDRALASHDGGLGLVRARVASGPWSTLFVQTSPGQGAVRSVRLLGIDNLQPRTVVTFCSNWAPPASVMVVASAGSVTGPPGGSAPVLARAPSGECPAPSSLEVAFGWSGPARPITWSVTPPSGERASGTIELSPWRVVHVERTLISRTLLRDTQRVVVRLDGTLQDGRHLPLANTEVRVVIGRGRLTSPATGDLVRSDADGVLAFEFEENLLPDPGMGGDGGSTRDAPPLPGDASFVLLLTGDPTL